jgi:hypothetical protein
MHPVFWTPPRRDPGPDGMRALDGATHPLALSMSAGEQVAVLRSGADRRPMPRRPPHHPVCRPPRREHPGGAAPATPDVLTSPSSKRSPRSRGRPLAGWASVADHPTGAHRKRRSRWLFDSVIHVPPRARAAHRLSLAGPPSPSGEGRRGSFSGERLEAEAPGRPARCRVRLRSAFRRSRRGSGSTRVTSTPRRACGRLRGGDLVSGLAKPPTRADPEPRVAPAGCYREGCGAIRTSSVPATPRRVRRCWRSEVPSTDSTGRGPGAPRQRDESRWGEKAR